MGIFDFRANASDHHFECRRCGYNLSAEVEECPECGGEVVGIALE